jgi:glutathione peroxidase
MKHAFAAALLVLAVAAPTCAQSAPPSPELVAKWKDKSMHTIAASSLEGAPLDLSQFRGKVVLVVNVASRCGFTGQYAGLQKLYDHYKDKGLVVLGIPSNDFGGQEPGSAEEIRSFCTTKYAVTFPMLAKAQTKAGPGQSEIYEFLGTRTGKLPGWNFSKYLVGKDGQPVAFYASNVAPDDPALTRAIEQALGIAASAPADKKPAGASGAAPADGAGTH